MNNFLTFLLMVLLVVGCRDNEPDPFIPTEPTCNLDVTVIRCPIFPCDNSTAENLFDVTVELFATEQDAIDGVNVLASRVTDGEGRARFISIDCGSAFVKVKSENNGTYIGFQNLSLASTLNFHEVRFVANNYYDNDDSAGLRQNHISLEFPTIGQTSLYRYFEDYSDISFSPAEYSDVFLRVRITDQLDEHSFIVEEKLDSLYGTLGGPTSGGGQTSLRNVWTITDTEVFVSPLNGDYFTSYVWGLSEWFENTEKGGFSFSLERPDGNQVNMATDFVAELGGLFSTISVADYTLFDRLYENLFGDRISYTSFDGPEKFRVYNREDGVIRYINFWDGGAAVSKGFDLVIE